MNYPTWFPDGETLATESGQGSTEPEHDDDRPLDREHHHADARRDEPLWRDAKRKSRQPKPHRLCGTAGFRLDLQSGRELHLCDGHLELRCADAARVRSADERIVQSKLSGSGALVVAGRQVGRFRIEPPFTIRSEWPLRHLPVSVWLPRTWACEADHQHDLQLQSREVVSDRFPQTPAGPFQLIVAAWQNGAATSPSGPYGLSVLDLTPLGLMF